MNLLLTTVLLLIGFFALIKSSDIFVDAISSIASNFKVSKIMIALTVAAFGTCAPELAISFNSMSTQAGDIALANVIGSNIVNILLVVGLAAFCAPIKVKNDVEKRELPILLVVTTLFSISIITHLFDGTSNAILIRQDGILFLFMFVIFIRTMCG